MKNFTAICGVLFVMAGSAYAGGIDRSGQPINIIYEKGNYAELSYGWINPSVSGNDDAMFGGRGTGSVAGDHNLPGIALKYDFNDQFSGAIIYDQAYGADILYPIGESVALGGTSAKMDSEGVTALLRYKFNDNISVHGGIRASKASGEVRLSGLAYGPLNGYNVAFDDAWGTGYVAGVAYEKPEIALRVALTYFSKVAHDLDTTETLPAGLGGLSIASVTTVDTPQAVHLDVQSGIAEDTLLFGNIRWVDWSEFLIDPQTLVAATGQGLVKLDDTTTYTLGVGRKFNDTWSGSVFVTYEPSTGDDLVSPLAPTNGYKGIGMAAVYTRDNMRITMGARYLDLGDAKPETGTPDTARASMENNDAVALGIKVGFSF
ncbi:MAG: OmpP1/FadL family transporter [Paracoccaceae bacterium]